MTAVKEIISKIERLSEDEFISLRNWIVEQAWEKWDKRIIKDSEKGNLDFLVREAQHSKKYGKLKKF